ncbi:MAG: hypothetical protein IIX04_05530 [Alistipes sp.]|nr:hypothetical protein [Alistipes sp.]
MVLSLIIFGLLTGSLLSVLVGLVGSRRRIGFGWTFILSVIFTPLIGLICTLISDPLPEGERRWGCVATLIFITVIALTGIFLLTFLSSTLTALI